LEFRHNTTSLGKATQALGVLNQKSAKAQRVIRIID
jgi:hypothetical protein